MANVIEEAKSGRASCRTCKQPIAKGELRLGIETANQFGDTPSLQWHHLACAANKLPAELRAALADYPGEVANRAELEHAMDDAIKSGKATPGGLPHVDRAPTGRARCLHCREPIEKGARRVAVERELETGGMVTSGAGYLHPACTRAHVEATGGSLDLVVAGLETNSRLPADELAAVLDEVRGGN